MPRPAKVLAALKCVLDSNQRRLTVQRKENANIAELSIKATLYIHFSEAPYPKNTN